MEKEKLLRKLEDEYEVRLVDAGSSSIDLLKYVRKEFGLSPLEAKEYIKEERVMYSKIPLAEAEGKAELVKNLGASIELNQTGTEYLLDYDPVKVEKSLTESSAGVAASEFYTTEIGGVLFESAGQTYFHLIEDDKKAKACQRFLIERGQVRKA